MLGLCSAVVNQCHKDSYTRKIIMIKLNALAFSRVVSGIFVAHFGYNMAFLASVCCLYGWCDV